MKEISFVSPRIRFASPMEEYCFKTVFFRHCSFEEIEEELRTYGIEVDHQKLLEEYKISYNIEHIVDEYHYRYKNELKKLDDKKLFLDSDCLFFYLRKLVDENFDVETLPDPNYIMEQINRLMEDEEQQSAERFINILKNIRDAAEYGDEPVSIKGMFCDFELDVAFVLSDFLQEEIRECGLKVHQCEEILSIVETISERYCDEELSSLCGDALALLASVSAKKAMKKLEQLLAKYPSHKLSLCMDCLLELIDDERYRKEVSQLEELMRSIEVVSEEDEMCMNLLNDVMEEKNSETEGIIN